MHVSYSYLRKRAKTLTAGGTQERIFSTGGKSSSGFGNNAEIINCKVKFGSKQCKKMVKNGPDIQYFDAA